MQRLRYCYCQVDLHDFDLNTSPGNYPSSPAISNNQQILRAKYKICIAIVSTRRGSAHFC